jgi:membrane-bound metal-dependent hydrolase YbcI (DUF457 family)
MTSKTHVALGLLAGLIALKYNPTADIYITVSGACIGSLIPDLDTKKSLPYQLVSPFAWVVDKLTKHRGFTHKVLPVIFISIYFLTYRYFWLMFGIGAFTHLIIDVVTRKFNVTLNSRGEKTIYVTLWCMNIVMIVVLSGIIEKSIEVWNFLSR